MFRNELKSDTREAIGKLKDGDVRPVSTLLRCYELAVNLEVADA